MGETTVKNFKVTATKLHGGEVVQGVHGSQAGHGGEAVHGS